MNDIAPRNETTDGRMADDGCPHHQPAQQGPDLRDVATATAQIDTSNRFLVSAREDKIVCFAPPRTGDRITREDALLLAAWLVGTADRQLQRFPAYLQAVLEA